MIPVKQKFIVFFLLMTNTLFGHVLPTIYHWDLRYTSSLSPEERYDIRHMAVCVQGLVNRDAPRVFLSFSNDDTTWLSRLTESGGLCEGWNVHNVSSLTEYVNLFEDYINGVVLYDEDPTTGVISTSLVATTAAGIENAIAVRKDTSATVYNYLINNSNGPQFPILIDLTGKFTGSGTIWQTSIPSTGSAKCDAYIWAKEKYLDMGKCDPTVIMYTLDLWGLKSGIGMDFDGWQTQLGNLDYGISKKGFCFELSPWGDEVPNDDPGQPLGTDRETFKAILGSCNSQTGQSDMIRFCGFTNWHFKYSDHVPGASIHQAHETEWATVELLSAYNTYMEADAPSPTHVNNGSFYSHFTPDVTRRRYSQNAPPTYNGLVTQGLIDGSGNVVSGNYITLLNGDYDGAPWTLYQLAGNRYDDSDKEQTSYNWGINPNLVERVSVAIDYMYRNKSENDFFIGWCSGAGYVDPSKLYGSRSPSGYPDVIDVWQEHCKKYYRMLDYSITPWIHDPLVTVSLPDYELTAPFSGDGMGSAYASSLDNTLVDNIPVIKMTAFDVTPSSAINYSSGVHFATYRLGLYYSSEIDTLAQGIEGSGYNRRCLDPYTFYYLMRHHLGGNNNYRATWISDTIPRIMETGETYPVTVTVRNDGWDTWSESTSYRLGYAIVPKGNIPSFGDYDAHGRFIITGTVAPGQSYTFDVGIVAPNTSGDYDIYYDIVRDGYCWFRGQNNIEWKEQLIVANNKLDIDTDSDGVPDVIEDQAGTLYWHPDDIFNPVSGLTFETSYSAKNDLSHLIGRATTTGWSASTSLDSASWLCYGPYDTTIPVGLNTASFDMKIGSISGNNDIVARIDVHDVGDSSVIASYDICRYDFVEADEYHKFGLEYYQHENHMIEFRTFWYDKADITERMVGVNSSYDISYSAKNDLSHVIGRAATTGWSASTSLDSAGWLCYGPYDSTIPVGLNTAYFDLKIGSLNGNDDLVVIIDVYDVSDSSIIASYGIYKYYFAEADKYQKFELEYYQHENHTIEFRTWWCDKADITERMLGVNSNYDVSYSAKNDLSHQIGRAATTGWSASTSLDSAGCLCHGPYDTTIPAGLNTAYFDLKIGSLSGGNDIVAKIDVHDVSDSSVMASYNIYRYDFAEADKYQKFELEYYQHENHTIEFRTHWYDKADITERMVGVNSSYDVSYSAKSDLSHVIGRAVTTGWSASTSLDPASWLCYGPYDTTIPAGLNTASFDMKIGDLSGNNDIVARIDVNDFDASSVIASYDICRYDLTEADEYQKFELEYYQHENHRIEFRTYWYDKADITERMVGVNSNYDVSYSAKNDLSHVIGRAATTGWSASTSLDSAGWLCYGPYDSTIPVGLNTACFDMKIGSLNGNDDLVVIIDVYDVSDSSIIASYGIYKYDFAEADKYQKFELEYYQYENHTIEFRTWWCDKADITERMVGVKCHKP